MSQSPRLKPLVAAIAAAVVAPSLLTGCSEERVDAAIYADVPACIAAGQDALACEQAFQSAGEQHAALAPRFTTQANCEAEFGSGACGDATTAGVEDSEGRTQEAGGGFFYPLMMGYLVGSALRGGQPLYRSTTGNWRNTAGNSLGSRAGAVSVPKSAAASAGARTTVTRRGGFTAPRASSSFGG